MWIKKITFATLLLLKGLTGGAQPAIDSASIHSYLAMQQEQLGFSGVIRITYRGELQYEKAFGMASIELEAPMKTTGVFQIASISKPFTAMLTLMACREGRLSAQDAIGKFYPQLIDTAWRRITIGQLLTHRSGIPHNDGIAAYWQEKAFLPLDRERCLSELFGMALLAVPGEQSHYSSPGYFLLADILEQVYGQPYATLVSEKITEPLALKHTGVCDGRTIITGNVSGYHRIGEHLLVAPHRDPSLMKGSGNLYASAADLADWLASLGDGRWPSELVSMLLDTTSTVPMTNGDRYGHGFYYRKAQDNRKAAWYHGGGTFGTSALAVWYPEEQLSIVLLSNVSVMPVNQLWADLEKILNGITPDLPESFSHVQLPDSVLMRFAGTYAAQGMELSIVVHEHQLYAKLGGKPAFELKPVGAGTFFGPKTGVRITFQSDSIGAITGLVAEREGKPLTFERK